MKFLGIKGDSVYSRFVNKMQKASPVSFQKDTQLRLKTLTADRFQLSQNNPLLDNSLDTITLDNPIEPDGYRKVDNKLVPYFKYKNEFPEKLKAQTYANVSERLALDPTIHDLTRAETRITSFSRYLKEHMVGFITPEGDNWLERACKYIIKGSAGVDVPEICYKKYAKDFWGLMAKADPFWTSDKFIDYMKSLDQNPAVNATVKALEGLQMDEIADYSQVAFGYTSPLRFIPELLEGCAYSGQKMELNYDESHDPLYPTLEHLFPHVEGGDKVNKDCNYVLTVSLENSRRSDIPLTAFLRGWDAEEYYKESPEWKEKAEKKANVIRAKQECFEKLSSSEKKEVKAIYKSMLQGELVILDKYPENIRKAVAFLLRKQKEGLMTKFNPN